MNRIDIKTMNSKCTYYSGKITGESELMNIIMVDFFVLYLTNHPCHFMKKEGYRKHY